MCIEEKDADSIVLAVYVQPRSARNRIIGRHGDCIKIAVNAPPVDGKANAAVVELLSKLFARPRSAITLKSGEQARKKLFLIAGISRVAAQERLAAEL